MRQRFVGVALVCSVGCAEYDMNADFGTRPSSTSTIEDGAETLTTASPPADTGATFPDTTYYSVDLRFDVAGSGEGLPGVWQVDTARLAVELWSAEPAPVCAHTVPITTVTEVTPPEMEPPLIAWWQLDLEAGVPSDVCPEWPARTWWVGVGPYDTRLDPMLAQRGMLAFDVYGLYLQEDPAGPVYVIGFAGTNDMVLGHPDLTVDVGPLPDGGYQAQSLVLMSLD